MAHSKPPKPVMLIRQKQPKPIKIQCLKKAGRSSSKLKMLFGNLNPLKTWQAEQQGKLAAMKQEEKDLVEWAGGQLDTAADEIMFMLHTAYENKTPSKEADKMLARVLNDLTEKLKSGGTSQQNIDATIHCILIKIKGKSEKGILNGYSEITGSA